ncbi:MAG: TVP38/TMEM64 family protein [Bacilli bacterium]
MITDKKQRLIRSIITLCVFLLLMGLLAFLYFSLGLNKLFYDEEALKEEISSFGSNAKIIFVLIQFIQTTILPISNVATIIVGRILFGPWQSALLTSIGVLAGSIIAFLVGKLFGRKVVDWILGQEVVEKYLKILGGKQNLVIFVMLLFPFFPDDVLCFVAGLTSMSWLFFLITILLTRPLPIFLTSYFFDSSFIPLHGWGLLVWGMIILIGLFLVWLVKKRWVTVNAFLDKINDKLKK